MTPGSPRPAISPPRSEPAGSPRISWRWPTLALAALLSLAAFVRLALAWREVPSRSSFGWDAARRAVLNLEAAQALRELRPLRLLLLLAGRETWPTLRMALIAPILAFTGPSAPVEGMVSCAFFGLLLGMTVLAAAALVPQRPLLAGAVAATAVATQVGLLGYAATPMLEPLSALLTAASLWAWLRLRAGGEGAPVWPLALAGNLLFHAKWQHGILLAVAVTAVEAAALEPAERRRTLRALAGALRRRAFAGFAAAAGVCVLAAVAIAASGGLSTTVLGLPLEARTADGPAFWAVFALFCGACLELWRGRERLRREVPARLRALVVWLALPMAGWTLVPFTWRLRTMLVTSTSFDPGGGARIGPLGGVRFHLGALFLDGWSGAARAAMLLGVAATGVAALRSQPLRRRLWPVMALLVVELAALGLGTRANFQARFSLNLVPAIGLLSAAALSALPPAPGRVFGSALLALLLAGAAPLWSSGLALALAPGFNLEEIGTRCAALARALPPGGGFLVNETSIPWRQDCALAFFAEARRRGVSYDPERDHALATDREGLHVGHACEARPPALVGFLPDGPPRVDGPLCARRYRRP